ncbi:peroxidase-related enzyme [Microbacterium sp. Marseille-Q6965]|uniref:peroxidase-related enzyme n=1 Tax=Microbacterium sp. Marseille-Q6965 TaxID=2965072 RepID=UPI0021B7191F|nr:peroxidase-related enzyme [Microbacterium sp. Marseille-Q6965]
MTSLRASLGPLLDAVDARILPPTGGGPLTVRQRLRVAYRVALVNEAAAMSGRLERRLQEHGWGADVALVDDPAGWDALGDDDTALLELADQMAVDPSDVDGDDIARVRALGIASATVVATAQVVAYASFRTRLDEGLGLLGRPERDGVAAPLPPLHRTLQPGAETFPTLTWRPWVEPAEVVRHDGDGLPAKLTPFYRTLAHEPEILAARTALYDEIMAGEGALSRQDRELVALATSLTTGCEYCASVHGRRHMQLSQDRTTAVALATVGASALQTERDRALVALGARAALTPSRLDGADVRALETAKFSPAQIADALAAAALFAWANRLMMTLGAPA